MGAGQAVAAVPEDHQEEKQLCCELCEYLPRRVNVKSEEGTNSTVRRAGPPLGVDKRPGTDEGGDECRLHGDEKGEAETLCEREALKGF